MSWLWRVWTIPYVEQSALDEIIMMLEVVGVLMAVVVIRVYVIDRLRGVKYYKEK